MSRLGWALLLMVFTQCKNEDSGEAEEGAFGMQSFAAQFTEVKLPYRLADTSLLRQKDTQTLRRPEFLLLLDTIKQGVFGKTAPRYYPLARIHSPSGASFFVVKAMAQNKQAAYLLAYNKNGEYAAAFPFLVPDKDPGSLQVSSIEQSSRKAIINRGITRKINEQMAEGRDVYEFDMARGKFNLVMTDIVDDRNNEVINPIDTFARTNKFAGDYIKDASNFVSVRDSRYTGQLMVFIHTSKNKGACVGELKGDFLMTSTNTAVYRQGGDPCVLELRFTNNSVTLKEMEGCGARRGLECVFDGTFQKKKPKKEKAGPSKSS